MLHTSFFQVKTTLPLISSSLPLTSGVSLSSGVTLSSGVSIPAVRSPPTTIIQTLATSSTRYATKPVISREGMGAPCFSVIFVLQENHFVILRQYRKLYFLQQFQSMPANYSVQISTSNVGIVMLDAF